MTRRPLVLVAALMLASSGCIISGGGPRVGETHNLSKSVPLGETKSVAVEIKMGAGELKVAGGASDLMNADFTYNVDAWKPEVNFEAGGGQAHLTIEQPRTHGHGGSTRNDWDIRLNDHVATELTANLGAGKANLNLVDLSLSRFEVNLGAGETDVNLDGHWAHDLTGSVQGGVGKATLHLPRDVGVRVTAQGGLGAINANGFAKNGDVYTNDAYGKSKVNLNIDVQGGVGEINLVLGGGGGTV
ncbi:MAG TPA: toast rack family protein [Terriglobia bacterium]|nr:toast rack family protein [Terriglobia bacterium]